MPFLRENEASSIYFLLERASLMQHSIIYRLFEPRDQTAVRQLILNRLGEHYGFIDETRHPDIDDIRENYISTGATFLVAQLNEQIVGTGGLFEEEPNIGRIVRMSVDHVYRRHGIGRTIIQHLIEVARQRGYIQLRLETNNDWYSVIAFYTSLGFIVDQWTAHNVHMSMVLRT